MSSRGPLDHQPSEPGWWLASDGRWYPPESVPAAQPWAPPAPAFGSPYGPPGRKRRAGWVIPVIVVALLAFGGCGVAILAVARNHTVRETITAFSHGADRFYTAESETMAPTLEIGDRFAATTKIGTIERGDVLVVRSPQLGGPLLVTRVLGLPGDTIAGRNGRLFVNGAPLAEPYLPPGTATSDFPRVAVGPDSYFLLGDNRGNSRDSRSYGPVDRSTIVAVVLRVVSPSSHAGKLAGSPRS